jgi:hypothetical protein
MQNPYPTKINDVRPNNHGSLSVIPRFLDGDYDRLQHHWKFEILFDHGHNRANSGELFWGIDTIEVKAGPATLQPQVRDLNGNLIVTPPGILMFNRWPSAPVIEFEADPRYFNRAVVGFTEGNGSIGWGFGGESWINAAEPASHDGGPYSVWCSAHPENFQPPENRVIGSDCLHKIGWWDDHIVINPIFRIMRKAGAPPPNGGQSELRVFDNDGSFVGKVKLESGQGDGGRIALFSGDTEQAYVELE